MGLSGSENGIVGRNFYQGQRVSAGNSLSPTVNELAQFPLVLWLTITFDYKIH
jgi:hypothetical protein